MKLIRSYETTYKIDNAVIHDVLEVISKDVNSREEAKELGYLDFDIKIYVNGRMVHEISRLLSKAGTVWQTLIDDTDWELLYCEQISDMKDQQSVSAE